MIWVRTLRFLLIKDFICAASAVSYANPSITTECNLKDHCIGLLYAFQRVSEKQIMRRMATSCCEDDYNDGMTKRVNAKRKSVHRYHDGVKNRKFFLQLIAHTLSSSIFKITIPFLEKYIILKREMQSNPNLFNEIEIIKKIGNHDNIVKIFYAKSENVKNIEMYSKINEENRRINWIFMEELKFNFYEYYLNLKRNNKMIDTRLLTKMLRDILNVLSQCHSKNIVHGDLKLGNIMGRETLDNLDILPDFVLIDFGYSIESGKNELERRGLTFTVGTTGYKSPESMGEGKILEIASDIWSLGIIAFKCVYLERNRDLQKPYLQFLNNGQSFIEDSIDQLTCSNEMKKFINGCLIIDPKKRATAEELLENSLFISV